MTAPPISRAYLLTICTACDAVLCSVAGSGLPQAAALLELQSSSSAALPA